MLYVLAFIIGTVVGGAVVWLFRPTIAADVKATETEAAEVEAKAKAWAASLEKPATDVVEVPATPVA